MPEPLYFQIDEYYLDLQKQGQDMAILDSEQTQRNPFPGLRPFRTGEAHLFFGREGQAEELIARLMRTHFLGVLGNSGSGKSSLVRAGLIPALHAGKKQRRIADWKIVICRPGNTPLQNLAAALAGANLNSTDESILVPEVQRLLPILKDSSFGLLEARPATAEPANMLLIVDQFEELFRFSRDIPAGEAAHFTDLLLTAVLQEGSRVYSVITMRSEFLGECVRYRGLPEIINDGQYLVPRLTGENVRRAVTGPLGVVSAPADPTLVNRLVREVGDNMDQLPLLQHALMRSYQYWQQRGKPESPIGHADYEAVGGIEKALSLHANERFAAFDEQGQRIAKIIFQRLTDLSNGDRGGRRPTIMEDIFGTAQAINATPEQIRAVIDQFRQSDTSFLMPPPGVLLHAQNMLDISHESLIRNWERLAEWAAEEVQNARLYRRVQQGHLENTEDGHQGWIKGALLQRLGDWRQTTPLNHFWAARYHLGRTTSNDWTAEKEEFEGNMIFLDQCLEAERSREKEKEGAIAEKAKQRQRARYRSIIIALSVGAAILSLFLAGWALFQRKEAKLAQKNALTEKAKSDSLAMVAERSRQSALEALDSAAANLTLAQKEEARARTAVEQVKLEKAATEDQRQRAERNFRTAQDETERARNALKAQQIARANLINLTLAEVDRLVYNLEYDNAYSKIQTILSIGVSQKEVSDALLEFAFWYAETSKPDRAWAILDTAYQLAGRTLPKLRGDHKAVRIAIGNLNAGRSSFLQTRYYPVMKNIPAGTDTLGKNYIVTISPFQIAETETTWWQYNLFCVATGRKAPGSPDWGINGDNPVVNVSWYDCVEYLNWLSEQLGHPRVYAIDQKLDDPNNISERDDLKWTVTIQQDAILPANKAGGFRLPTEAEWEYAARAGENFSYAGGEDILLLAWYIGNCGGSTKPVKIKLANGYGLYDMSGNVWEWCWDWYGNDYTSTPQTNPIGPISGSDRIMRGGSWDNGASQCQVSNRNIMRPPNQRINDQGFRPARTVKF